MKIIIGIDEIDRRLLRPPDISVCGAEGIVPNWFTLLFDIASDVRLGIVTSFRQHDVRFAVPIYMVLDQEGKQMGDNPLL